MNQYKVVKVKKQKELEKELNELAITGWVLVSVAVGFRSLVAVLWKNPMPVGPKFPDNAEILN